MKVYEMLHKRINEVDSGINLLWAILDDESKEENHAEAKILMRECDITIKKLLEDIRCGEAHIESDGTIYGLHSLMTKEQGEALAMWLQTMLGEADV